MIWCARIGVLVFDFLKPDMIGRAAAAVRRVCSMLAPAASKSRRHTNFSSMDPDLNQFCRRFSSITRDGGVCKNFSISSIPFPTVDDAFVKYRSLEVEVESSSPINHSLSWSHNDKPIFIACFSLENAGFYFLPILLEDDGILSLGESRYAPSRIRRADVMSFSFNGVLVWSQKDKGVIVWNPTTSKGRTLPDSPHNIERFLAHGLKKHTVFVAVWTDNPKSEEDYKVINFFSYQNHQSSNEDCYPIEIELYSRKTDSWKRICWGLKEWPSWPSRPRQRSCYVNGVIYMTALDQNSNEIILCFDFSDETFSTLPLPLPLESSSNATFELVKYNGQLSVFSRNEGADMLLHWVMRDGQWVRVGEYHVYGVDRPLGFARNDELLVFEFHRMKPRPHYNLMVFDSTTGELKDVPCFITTDHFKLFEFHETFVKLW